MKKNKVIQIIINKGNQLLALTEKGEIYVEITEIASGGIGRSHKGWFQIESPTKYGK